MKKQQPQKSSPPAKMGAPTKYKPEYCEQLIKHMSEGGSFSSFGAIAQCGKNTLYEWLEAHPDFQDAKTRGAALSENFYEGIGKMLATGQARRLVKETVKIIKDKDGNEVPAIDPLTGKVIMEREYAPTMGNAAIWIFMMKNMHGWRDHRNIALSGDGKGAPIKVQPVEKTAHDDLREIIEVQKILKEIEDAELSVEHIKITD